MDLNGDKFVTKDEIRSVMAERRPAPGQANAPKPPDGATAAPPSSAVAPPPDVSAPPRSAKKTGGGVFYKILVAGRKGGVKPTRKDTVRLKYTGWTTDGKSFESAEAEFQLSGVIPGWVEAVETMVVGQKNRIWVPEALAYGGKPNRPQGMLVYEIELLKVN
jgi:peptidylprolyl isomerase